MFIGSRIKYFRLMRGMTQKQLGMAVGFPERNADIRIAQYESSDRIPKNELLCKIADKLNVSPYAIRIPDVSKPEGLMQTLFYLEDLYGLKIGKSDGELILLLNDELKERLAAWYQMSKQLAKGCITEEEYDNWRYKAKFD